MRRILDFIADYWGLLIFLGLIMLFIAVTLSMRWAPKVPICPEDAIFLGGGQYQDGYWDYLYCGPALDNLS